MSSADALSPPHQPAPAPAASPAAAPIAPAEVGGISLKTRPVRVLIGWLSPAEGPLWLGGRKAGETPEPAHVARCQLARDVVAQRPAGIDQTEAFGDIPVSLAAHFAELDANPRFAQVRANIGEPKMVDLTKICAAQPSVVIEAALDRVMGIAPDDLVTIAEITLPTKEKGRMAAVTFDPHKNTWVMSSPNPNLRVLGHFASEPEGFKAFGFLVETTMSYMHVAGLNGRYFLRDGYHRAYGLLSAGITKVPAFVKNHATIEDVSMPAGLLQQHAFLGERPAMLTDYDNVDVSAPAEAPTTQKVVVIQALEVNTLG